MLHPTTSSQGRLRHSIPGLNQSTQAREKAKFWFWLWILMYVFIQFAPTGVLPTVRESTLRMSWELQNLKANTYGCIRQKALPTRTWHGNPKKSGKGWDQMELTWAGERDPAGSWDLVEMSMLWRTEDRRSPSKPNPATKKQRILREIVWCNPMPKCIYRILKTNLHFCYGSLYYATIEMQPPFETIVEIWLTTQFLRWTTK